MMAAAMELLYRGVAKKMSIQVATWQKESGYVDRLPLDRFRDTKSWPAVIRVYLLLVRVQAKRTGHIFRLVND